MIRRGLAAINAGLDPSRAAARIPPGQRVHVVGVAGAAAAAACLLAHHAGALASGCDSGGPSSYTPPLRDAGIELAWEHDPRHVRRGDRLLADRLAVTKALTAIQPDHPELVAARESRLPLTSVQQLIADAAATRGARLVGVAGTHGKSTTTGWLLHLLVGAGLDPSGFVGALLAPALVGGARPSTVRIGRGPHFLVEADEYAGNFDAYRPALGVLLNADWDHPDVFASRDDVSAAFATWIRAFDGAGEEPVLVANAADPGVRATLASLRDWPGRLVVTAVVEGGAGDATLARRDLERAHATRAGAAAAMAAAWSDAGAGRSRLHIVGLGREGDLEVVLEVPGLHNAHNGLAAAAAAFVAGADPSAIADGLTSFHGVGRRMELKGEVAGVVVLDDYAHHPTAMAATFRATRQRYPGRRLWAVYEPLTFHRTAAMLDAFATVLATADRVAIADIFAGRDPDTTITSAAALAAAVGALGVPAASAPGSVEATADWLAGEVRHGDVVLVMGGGRSNVIADRLVATLRAAPPPEMRDPDRSG